MRSFPAAPQPENVLAAVEKYKVTVLHCVATVYRRLLAMPEFEKQHDLTSLRCSHSTGEALREATYEEWKRRVGSELYEHYGVSEYQLVIGNGVRDPVKPGSVGKQLPGVGAAILDDDLKPVASGELGQLAISTSDPGLFLGYYKDPERTEAVIRNGWYLTGDLAYQDSEGYFFIAGRRDDCFKSRGIFISPTEIENALQKHPAIIEAAVVPVPDSDIGNKIHAIVVLADGYTPSSDFAQSIRESLALPNRALQNPSQHRVRREPAESAVRKNSSRRVKAGRVSIEVFYFRSSQSSFGRNSPDLFKIPPLRTHCRCKNFLPGNRLACQPTIINWHNFGVISQ